MPPRVLIPLVVVAVVFWVYSIIDCALQPATKHRGLSKPAWVALVLLLPVVGGILWFTIGRVRKNEMLPTNPVGYGTRVTPEEEARRARAQAETDARIKDLEEQLRKLDEEEAQERERQQRGEDPDETRDE